MIIEAMLIELQSARLLLRQVRADDLPELLAIHRVDVVNRYLPYTTWVDMADAQTWFARVQQRQREETAVHWLLVDHMSQQVLGFCLLFNFDLDSGRAELGYALGQPFWRRGYMREALQVLIDATFQRFGLRRLEAEVDPRNQASHQLLLSLGFVHEGQLRQRRIVKGEIKDANLYGLLSHEWQGRHG